MVELTLAMPLLLLLITAIIQFGSMYNTYEDLTDAARAGARELAVSQGQTAPCDTAVTYTVNATDGDFTLPSADVTPIFPSSSDYCGSSSSCGTYVYKTYCNTPGSETPGDEAEIKVTYPYTLSIFGLSLITVHLSTTAADAVE